MHLPLTWSDIALRLLLAFGGGLLIGADRGEHGRPAGLRTTTLVCLAATISMIQVNLLLPLSGKAGDSYVVMDLMRLPLGILSGMGFIGAGAILRRDNLVLGVTTAATLWFVTVMGLCFGGGQLGLGVVACILAVIVLRLLKPIEKAWKQTRRGALTVTASSEGPSKEQIMQIVQTAGYRVRSSYFSIESLARTLEVKCELDWHGRVDDAGFPDFLDELAGRTGVLKVSWQA